MEASTVLLNNHYLNVTGSTSTIINHFVCTEIASNVPGTRNRTQYENGIVDSTQTCTSFDFVPFLVSFNEPAMAIDVVHPAYEIIRNPR